MIQKLKNRAEVLRNDPHMREVALGALLAFALKIVGAGLMFGFNVAIARLLGAEGTGLYFLAFSIIAICSVISRLGLDNSLLRFIATHATKEEWGKVKGVYALGMRMALITSGLISLILFVLAPWVAEYLFNKPELTEPLRWMSLSILPFTLLNLQAESLKGLKCIRDAMLIQGVGLPLVALALIFPLVEWSGILGVVLAYTLGAIIVSLLGAWRWQKNISQHPTALTKFPFKELWESCKPLLMVALMNRALMPWAPILLLGIWVTAEEVGVFGAATRIVLLVSFMLVAINNIVAPKFAELYAKENMKALGEVARRSAFLITLLASPIFLVLFFYGEWVMSLFGSEFTEGATILAILAVGQLINVLCGSVGYLLMMSGNEKVYRNITISSALLQLFMIFILAPSMGGVGVAIASSAVLAIMNLVSMYYVYSKLKILMFPISFKRIGK